MDIGFVKLEELPIVHTWLQFGIVSLIGVLMLFALVCYISTNTKRMNNYDSSEWSFVFIFGVSSIFCLTPLLYVIIANWFVFLFLIIVPIGIILYVLSLLIRFVIYLIKK